MYAILVSVLLLLPSVTQGAGLVPCGGPGQDDCQFCHFLVLVKNISNWLVIVFGVIVTLLFIYAGLRMAVTGKNASTMRTTKTIIVNTFVGYVILLAAWLIITFVMSSFLPGDGNLPGYGFWDVPNICVPQP